MNEFTECKLCGKKFLVIKKQGIISEKICSECETPRQNVIFLKREVRVTEWRIAYG